MEAPAKTINCPICKTENSIESTTCIKCGADLSVEETLPLSHESVLSTIATAPHKINLDFVHGQDFGTRYRIIEEIGKGGMGKVYKAFDKELNQVVALKMIHPEHCTHPEALKHFKKELLLAREITHKNVIRIHDIGDVNGIKYISMPFIEGLTLKDYIQTSRKVSMDTAKDVIRQICDGLQAAHEKGILHRDLKTQNIMVDHKGQVYILDFGIARSLLSDESSSFDGKVIGTPEYMSPEQAQGKPTDQRSDIYSLGIIMYELMTGKVPFSGFTISDLLLQQITAVPGNPSEFNSDIPQSMEKIILKCLAKDPAHRFQSIQEISDAFSQETVPMKAVKPKSALPRWLWDISALIIIAISILLYFVYFKKAPHPAQTKTILLPESSAPVPVQWKNSIAVLPFRNISADPNQDYFCEGITEQLITNLAKLKDLKVIARTSIMLYKNSSKDIRQIAKELNVGNVLEGSVRKSGEHVRITAQLINAADGSNLWAQDYDRKLKDIFILQDEVSQNIAESLHVTVRNQIVDTAQKTQPQNIEAYNNYLKAKYVYFNKYYASYTEKDRTEALRYAMKSIEIDPEYALGYSIIARLYQEYFLDTNSQDDLQKAEHYANLAYKFGPDVPESLRAMQQVLLYKRDYDQSFNFLKKLMANNPNDFENNYMFEWFYLNIGLPKESIKYASRAIELNPMNFDVYSDRALAYRSIGDKENYIRDVRICLSIQPDAMACKIYFAYYLLWTNDFQNADKYIAGLEQQVNAEKSPQTTMPLLYGWTKVFRALYFVKLGKKDQALAITKHFYVFAELGMAHEAAVSIQKIIKSNKNEPYLYSYDELSHSPFFERIRNDPEFQKLIDQQKPIYDDMIRKWGN